METPHDYEKVENSATMSSSIMMKLPTDNLGPLRSRFQESAEGLPLPEFLEAVVKNMELTAESDVLSVTADLIDFFHLVDINGDGFMEWEEFVMFILDAVVKEEEEAIAEKVVPHGIRQIQPAAVRIPVKSAHFIPSLNKLLVGVGQSIQIYTVNDKAPELTSLVYVVHLEGSDKLETTVLPGEKPFTVFDLAFCTELAILCVLRSDLKLEFIRFMSLANYSKETIQHLGVIAVEQSYSKICFRNKINEDVPSRLMAIGTNSVIDTWVLVHGEDDQVRISEHFMMKKHTDYVRDLLIIKTDCLRFIASASMDKKVVLWDLYTMQYKSVRTGHSAGVECLAFDGKSLLLAGGYDYTIIAWDLDAEINRPLFSLIGHESAVIQMVAIHNIERCISLDENGVIRWWDICKTHASDGDSRLIDTICAEEDHARTISVFRNLGYSFDTLHGCLVIANGRRQHTFKFKNVGRIESPPIAVLFSKKLLTIYTIHQRDIIFWSAVTGEKQKCLSAIVGPNTRLMVATLDNRERRLFTGDSTGTIAVYNCLNGMFLKQFQFLNSPIRELIFSRDKNIIVLTYASDIYVMDDSCDDPHEDPDSILRELKCTPDIAEIVLMAYSYRLGLIAVLDIMGRLVLLDYQYMTIDLIVDNVTNAHSTVNDMQFLEHYPVLVLVDNEKNFTIITLKTRTNVKNERILRVETVAPMPSKEEMAAELLEEEEGVEEEEEVIGTKATPYNKRRLHRFKRLSKDIRHMTLLQQVASEHIASHDEESTATNAVTVDSKLSITDDEPVSCSAIDSNDVTVRAVLGFEDGEIGIIDLTKSLLDQKIPHLTAKDCVQNTIGYNPKAKCIRAWSTSLTKLLSPEEVTRREMHYITPLDLVFRPHSHEVTALHVIGDFDFILTASNDSSVQLWSLEGHILGILTRGSVLDNLFKKHWQNPVDMRLRSDIRMAFAREMVDKLFLKTIVSRRISCNVVKTSSYLDFKDQNRVSSPGPRSAQHTASTSSLPPDMKITAPTTLEDMTKTLRKIKKLPDRERVMFQLQGHITYDPSKKDVTQLLLQSSKSNSSLPKLGAKKKKRAKKKELFSDKSAHDEHHKYLQTIKMADEYLNNQGNVEKNASTTSLRKWQYELEMSEIDAQDPTNWEISSINRKKSMYANWMAELAKNGVLSNKQAVIDAKLNAFSPNKDFSSFTRFMHGTTGRSARLKRQASVALSEQKASPDALPPTKTEPTDETPQIEAVNVDTSLSMDYFTFEDGNIISKHTTITNSYPTFEREDSDADDAKHLNVVAESEPPPQAAASSPNFIAFRDSRPPSSNLPPLVQTSSNRPMRHTQSHKHLKPEQVAEQNRIETRRLVEKFEHDLAIADKIDKRTRRNKLRKRVRPTHHLQRDDSHRSSYSCAQKMIAKQSSFEGMLAVGRKQLMAEMNWVRKVKQLAKDADSEPTLTKTTGSSVASKEKHKLSSLGRQASFTLFGIVKDEMAHKQQEEQRILARQSFGPYKASELSELYMIFQSLPKRVPSEDDRTQYSGINVAYTDEGEEIAYIYLTDLFEHPFIMERQYYREQLEKQVKKSIDRNMGPYYTISNVLAILCPLMTSTDRKDCMKFFSLHAKNEDMGETVDLTDHKVERLRLMFEFFDVDQSGTVDKSEIVQAMNRHMNVGRRRFSNAMLKGIDHIPEGNVTEEYIDSMIKGADVDKNEQLDFAEFKLLFGNMVD